MNENELKHLKLLEKTINGLDLKIYTSTELQNFEELIKEQYEKNMGHFMCKENAPFTIEVLKVLHNKNLSVYRALDVLNDSQYIINRIAKF